MSSNPRLPLTDAEWPADILDLREGFAGQLNVYRTMAYHPALLRAWSPLRQHVVKDTSLGPARSEVVILRTGLRLGSYYEWAHHVSRARALGFSDERIAALRGMPEGEDGLIVSAVDALIDEKKLSEELKAQLEPMIGVSGIIDLIATVGFYSVLGYLLMTYETPVDEKIAAELRDRPL